MKVKSIRIPDDLDNAIDYVSKIEKIDKTQPFRKLARIGYEYFIAKQYKEGRISLRNVTGQLNLTLSESIDLLAEFGVTGNIRTEDVLASVQDK